MSMPPQTYLSESTRRVLRTIRYRQVKTRPMPSNRGGRPSKGDRKLYRPRFRRDVAKTVVVESTARDLYQSEFIALLVAEAHGFHAEMPKRKLALWVAEERAEGPLHCTISTRLPIAVAQIVDAEASARDLGYGPYIALIVSRALGFGDKVPEPTKPVPPRTEQTAFWGVEDYSKSA